jgi:hypothetical protein
VNQPAASLAREVLKSLLAILLTGTLMGVCIGFVAIELIRHLIRLL